MVQYLKEEENLLLWLRSTHTNALWLNIKRMFNSRVSEDRQRTTDALKKKYLDLAKARDRYLYKGLNLAQHSIAAT